MAHRLRLTHRRRSGRGLPRLSGSRLVLGLSGTAALLGWIFIVQPVIAWWAVNEYRVLQILRWAGPLAGIVAVLVVSQVVRVKWSARQRRVDRVRSIDDAAGAGSGRNDGKRLERGVAALLQQDGYTGVLVSGGANDRGMDVSGWHPVYGLVVLQCKDYTTKAVGSAEMQAFLGTCWDILNRDGRLADRAVFVTTSTFTAEARTLASAPRDVRGQWRTVVLVDRAALLAWCQGTWSPLPMPVRQEAV